MTLTYGSVCSGIEAVTMAWHPLGMTPAFFSETDAFCSAVLAHHWPEVPNLGDFTKIGRDGPAPTVDVLIGGTPCQPFSQAGRREGLRDPRGNLALEFILLAARVKARWVVWENVPGVLFSRGAEGEDEDEPDPDEPTRNTNWMDFGTVLGAMAELGLGFSYRVLDAQHFGVAQRRRRVFVVGRSGGDWRAAAAVLLERESMRGTPPPRRAPGTQVARTIAARAPDRDPDFSGPGNLVSGPVPDIHPALTTRPYADQAHQGYLHVVSSLTTHPTRDHKDQLVFNVHPVSTDIVRNSLAAQPTSTAEALTSTGPQRRSDRGDMVVMPLQSAEATNGRQGGIGVGTEGAPSYTLTTRHDAGVFVEKPDDEPVTFDPAQVTHPENRSRCAPGQPAAGLTASGRPHLAYQSVVRRLTPREYERLQGMPDDFTLISWRGKPAPDGRRYKAVGNSMAVPVMEWLGRRILMVDQIIKERDAED